MRLKFYICLQPRVQLTIHVHKMCIHAQVEKVNSVPVQHHKVNKLLHLLSHGNNKEILQERAK